MRKAGAALLAVLSLALMAQAKPVLVPDVSARRIEIRYSFTGAQLLLFGAILYPRGRIPEKVPDIVVVLRGPVQPILVREKAEACRDLDERGLVPFPLRAGLLCRRFLASDLAAAR